MSKRREQCRTCRWWERKQEAEGAPVRGFCRCRPPEPQSEAGPGGPFFQVLWPLTLADDWCREWETDPWGKSHE